MTNSNFIGVWAITPAGLRCGRVEPTLTSWNGGFQHKRMILQESHSGIPAKNATLCAGFHLMLRHQCCGEGGGGSTLWVIINFVFQLLWVTIIIITRSLPVAKRPCDCCMGQFWPRYNWDSIFCTESYSPVFNYCDVIGLLIYRIRWNNAK